MIYASIFPIPPCYSLPPSPGGVSLLPISPTELENSALSRAFSVTLPAPPEEVPILYGMLGSAAQARLGSKAHSAHC